MTRLPALAALLTLALTTGAHAATITQLGRGPGPIDGPAPTIVGPQPAGTDLAYVYGTPIAGYTVATVTPGQQPREIGRVPRSIDPALTLAASSGLVAVSRVDIDCREEFACHYEPTIVATDLLVGPATGPLTLLTNCPAGCGLPPSCIQRRMSASSAALLIRSGCNGNSVLLAGGRSRDLGPSIAAISDRSLAVAPLPNGQITVVGLDGTPRFTAPATPRLSDLAIDAEDVVGQWDGRTLSLSTQAAPAPRAVLSLGGAGGTLLGAGGRRFAVAQSLGEERGQRITVVDDSGTLVARTDLPASATNPGFDGARLTFAVPRCAATLLVSLPTGEPLPAFGSSSCTKRLTLRTTTARVATTGKLPLAFACARSATTGCRASLKAVARRRHIGRRENGAARFYQLTTAALRLDPGERGTLRPKLATGARRWIRRHRGDLDLDVYIGGRRTRIPLQLSAGR